MSGRKSKEDNTPPSRTLFVRNVEFSTKPGEVREKLEEFGDIKNVFDLIANRGLIFITFVSFTV
jgi:hypothetical protein